MKTASPYRILLVSAALIFGSPPVHSAPTAAVGQFLPTVASQPIQEFDQYTAGTDGMVGIVSDGKFHRFDLRQHAYVQTPSFPHPYLYAVLIPEWRAFLISSSPQSSSLSGAKHFLLGCRSSTSTALTWLELPSLSGVIAGKGSIIANTNSGSVNSLTCYDQDGTLLGTTTGLSQDIQWSKARVDISGTRLVALASNQAASFQINTTCADLPDAVRGQFTNPSTFTSTDGQLSAQSSLSPGSQKGTWFIDTSAKLLRTDPFSLSHAWSHHFVGERYVGFGLEDGSVIIQESSANRTTSYFNLSSDNVRFEGRVSQVLFAGLEDGYLAVAKDPGFTPINPSAERFFFSHLKADLAPVYTGPLKPPPFVKLRHVESDLSLPASITVAWASSMGEETRYIQRRRVGQTDVDWQETQVPHHWKAVKLSYSDLTFAPGVAYDYRIKVTQGTETAFSPIASIAPPAITMMGTLSHQELVTYEQDRWINLLGSLTATGAIGTVSWQMGVTFTDDANAAQTVQYVGNLESNGSTPVRLPLLADGSIPSAYYLWAKPLNSFSAGEWTRVGEHIPSVPPTPENIFFQPNVSVSGLVSQSVNNSLNSLFKRDYQISFDPNFASIASQGSVGPSAAATATVQATPGQQIWMRLRNRNAFHVSPWATPLTYTLWRQPQAPAITAKPTPEGILLQWNPADPNSVSFVIEGWDGTGQWQPLAEVPRSGDANTAMTYLHATAPGRIMEFRIRGANPTYPQSGPYSAKASSRMNFPTGTGFAVFVKAATGTRTTRLAPALAAMRPTLGTAKTSEPAYFLRNLATGEFREFRLSVISRRKVVHLGPILPPETQHQASGIKPNELWQMYCRIPDPTNQAKNRMEAYSGLMNDFALKSAPTDFMKLAPALIGTFEGWSHADVTIAVPKTTPPATTNATRLQLDTGSISLKLNLPHTAAVRTLPGSPSWENATAKVLAILAAGGYQSQEPPVPEATAQATIPASSASTSGIAVYSLRLDGKRTLWLERQVSGFNAPPYVKTAKNVFTGFLLRDLATGQLTVIATYSEYGIKSYFYPLPEGTTSLSGLKILSEEGKKAQFRTTTVGGLHTALLVGQSDEENGRLTHDLSYFGGDILKPSLLPTSRTSLLVPAVLTGRELSWSTGLLSDPRDLDGTDKEHLTQGHQLSRSVRKETFSTLLTDKVHSTGEVYHYGAFYQKNTLPHALIVVTRYLTSKGYYDLRDFL